MKYVQQKEEQQNQAALIEKQGQLSTVALISTLFVIALSLLIERVSPTAILDPRGVLIGVGASVCNIVLWRLIVRRLLMPLNRKRSSAGSSGMAMLLVFKLSFLTILLGALAGYAPELIAPALIGAIAFIFLCTLLIPFVSYNKG